MDDIGVKFLSELVGTAMLIILGGGVVAAVSLKKRRASAPASSWSRSAGASRSSPA